MTATAGREVGSGIPQNWNTIIRGYTTEQCSQIIGVELYNPKVKHPVAMLSVATSGIKRSHRKAT